MPNALSIDDRFAFYSKPGYYSGLTKLIRQASAGERVILATMSFRTDNPEVPQLLDEVCHAAKRGCQVLLAVDAYNFLINNKRLPGPLLLGRRLTQSVNEPYRSKFIALEELARSGGRYVITNQPRRPFTNPFAGRSHCKFAVINDDVFIGGCNLSEQTVSDLMVGWQDRKVADQLAILANKIASHGNVGEAMGYKDTRLKIDECTELLIDSGRPNQSIILEHAMRLIDDAKEWVMLACQYFPHSSTAVHLLNAHKRGVRIYPIYSHPSAHHVVDRQLQQLLFTYQRFRVPPFFVAGQLPKHQKKLHAKLIATEQGAIIGSHNYVPTGTKLGTAEIALVRYDAAFAHTAVTSFVKLMDEPTLRNYELLKSLSRLV